MTDMRHLSFFRQTLRSGKRSSERSPETPIGEVEARSSGKRSEICKKSSAAIGKSSAAIEIALGAGRPSQEAGDRRPSYSGYARLMKYPGSATKAKKARETRVNTLTNFPPPPGYSRT